LEHCSTPPPHKGELAPGQGPPSWGAKMACPGREKVMGANFAWGANFACGRGIQSIIDVSYRILVRMCPVHLVDHSLRSTKARHPSRRALKFAPGFKQFWGEPFRPFPSFRPLRAYAGVRTRRRPLVDEPPPNQRNFRGCGADSWPLLREGVKPPINRTPERGLRLCFRIPGVCASLDLCAVWTPCRYWGGYHLPAWDRSSVRQLATSRHTGKSPVSQGHGVDRVEYWGGGVAVGLGAHSTRGDGGGAALRWSEEDMCTT